MGEYKRWTERDVIALRRMFDQGRKDDEIAFALGRGQRSVAVKRYKLGLCHGQRRTRGDGALSDYSDDSLVDELNRRGYTCLREVRALRDYSDVSLRREIRRRGYGIRKKA